MCVRVCVRLDWTWIARFELSQHNVQCMCSRRCRCLWLGLYSCVWMHFISSENPFWIWNFIKLSRILFRYFSSRSLTCLSHSYSASCIFFFSFNSVARMKAIINRRTTHCHTFTFFHFSLSLAPISYYFHFTFSYNAASNHSFKFRVFFASKKMNRM